MGKKAFKKRKKKLFETENLLNYYYTSKSQ